jgi:hypothetical protein
MPTTLESLPRELRQQIFALAFDDAATKDHRLNKNIRTCIRRHDGYVRLEYDRTISVFRQALGPKPSAWPMMFASSICDLATTLDALYPDLKDDVTYILEKSLQQFEEAQDQEMEQTQANIDSAGPFSSIENNEAIEESARRAKARAERYDDGDRVYALKAMEVEDEWELWTYRYQCDSKWGYCLDLGNQVCSMKWDYHQVFD